MARAWAGAEAEAEAEAEEESAAAVAPEPTPEVASASDASAPPIEAADPPAAPKPARKKVIETAPATAFEHLLRRLWPRYQDVVEAAQSAVQSTPHPGAVPPAAESCLVSMVPGLMESMLDSYEKARTTIRIIEE